MSNIVLSSKNRIVATGATFYGNEDGALPLTNLRDPIFSKVWRYSPGTNADGNTARILFALAAPVRCGHVVFSRHNLSEAAQIRVRAGTARLDVDFTDDDLTSPFITFGGGVNGTRTNEYGVMVAGTCPRYEHDWRYPENGFLWSEDLTNPAWIVSNAKPFSGNVVEMNAGGTLRQLLGMTLYADTYEIRAYVRLLEGDGAIRMVVQDDAVWGAILGTTQTVTTEWQWVTWTCAFPGTAPNPANTTTRLEKLNARGLFEFKKVQFRRGASNGEYRKTTTQRLYQRIGVITEGGATNSLLRSREYDNAAWTKVGALVSPNTHVAVDGTTSIDTITSAGAGNRVEQDLTLGGTTARAFSLMFLRGGTATSVDLLIEWRTGGVTQNVQVRFNPSTGAFVSSAAAAGATLRTAGVKDLGNGRYRAYVEGVGADAANTQVRSQLFFNGAGTLFADGSQNEADCVTTYIPTTTAAVTRTVDTAVVEATWVPYAWNAAEGTLYHEAMADDIPTNVTRFVSRIEVSNASNDIVRTLLEDVGGAGGVQFRVNTYNGGVIRLDTTTAVSRGAVVRAAVRYRAADQAAAVNGALVATNVSATAMGGMTSVNLMLQPSGTAYLRRVTLWPTGKSNADLQALTTSGPSAIDFDSGWDDVLQMKMRGAVPTLWGHDYDIIKTFAERAVEWVRVQIYDPAKVDSTKPFEIGRAFMGTLTIRPETNPEPGMGDGWIERTTFGQAHDGRKFFNELPRMRQVAFTLPALTEDEGDAIHEMQGSGGIVEETLYLPDPDDEALCQRRGFVGLVEESDPLQHPFLDHQRVAIQITKKR